MSYTRKYKYLIENYLKCKVLLKLNRQYSANIISRGKMSGKDVKHLKDVSKEEQQRFIDSFDKIMFDCDGVVWTLSEKIKGAAETLNELNKIGKKVTFLSNNCTTSFDEYLEKFEKMGCKINKDQIIIPTVAIVDYLKSIHFKKKVFVIGCEVLIKEIEDAGIEVVVPVSERIPNSLSGLARHVKMDKDIGAVVLDVDLNATLLGYNNALLLLQNPNVQYIIGATDKYFPVASLGLNVLAPGYTQDSISLLTNRQPLVFGKPGKELSDFVKKYCHVEDSKRVLFVGDMLEQDMGFAHQSGFQKLLVLSGGTTREQLGKCEDPSKMPDYYLDSIHDLLPLLNIK